MNKTKEIKNLRKVAERIKKAIENKKNIVVYGDADLDGVSSVIIFKETLKNFGADVKAIYFPDREKEGYGINKNGLNFFKKYAPALFIAFDCGIGNFKEIKQAKKMGFEVIIVDHHEILDEIPVADIIVDPKQKGDRSFKYYAAAGLSLKLSEEIFKVFRKKMPESIRQNFLELSAMATIADMMPQEDENKKIINEGIKYLEKSWRPGIQALFELEELRGLNLFQKIYKINSLLNVRDVENGLPAAYRILTCPSKEEAKILAKKLYNKGEERKEKIEEIINDVEKKILNKNEPIIFEGSNDWDLSLLGISASYLCAKYKKPVFLFKKGKSESQGGVRTPKGFNSVEAMKEFSKKLLTYGGHPQASGFRIKNKNIEDFKKHLLKYFDKK